MFNNGTFKAKSDIVQRLMAFKEEHDIEHESVFQIILMFCEENNLNVEEVGQEIKKDRNFSDTLREDLKFNNEAMFDDEHNDKIKEWILI